MEKHTHPNHKKVVNRLAKIEGHTRSIKEMVENERDCSEVLLQIAAVRKALDNTAKVILSDHLESCVVRSVHEGNEEKTISDLKSALNNFIR